MAETFRNSPVPRDQGRLATLPAAIDHHLATWDLRPDGPVAHGSHALVIPVTRDDTPLVLRLNAPSEDVTAHVEALRFWRGRGTVQLVDAGPTAGAMLLERLDMHHSALHLPSEEAMAVLGVMARRLAVPAPPTARSTAPSSVRGRRRCRRSSPPRPPSRSTATCTRRKSWRAPASRG